MWESLRQSLDLSLFWEYRAILLAGLLQNVLVFASAAALATVLAVAVGLARLSPSPALRALATAHAELFRNVPEYVLLVWLHYVVPILISQATGGRVVFDPRLSAVLALGLAYSGFLSETVRAGILSIPRGHVEAGLALGMTRSLVARRIIGPQAVRRMLPEALNQYVSLFKATSIVSLIAVEDLMYQVSMITVYEMRPLPLYTGAALLYCAVIIAATTAIRRLTEVWRRRGLA